MADNTTLGAMTGGDVIATDDIAGVKHQRIKVEYGADGSATDVSPGTPLPVMIDTGTLLQRLEMLEISLRQLLGAAPGQMPDGYGRTRVTLDNIAGSLTLSTVSTVTTVNTVNTVNSLSKLGIQGYAPEQLFNNLAALHLRHGITVA